MSEQQEAIKYKSYHVMPEPHLPAVEAQQIKVTFYVLRCYSIWVQIGGDMWVVVSQATEEEINMTFELCDEKLARELYRAQKIKNEAIAEVLKGKKTKNEV